MSSTSKKTVLVTGCSAGGIGAALALALAKHGHNVYATARNTAKIPTELSGLPNVTTLQLDVSSSASVSGAAQAVSEKGKGLDVLVNNAGFGLTMPLLDVDVAQAQQLYDTNVWGALRTIQAFSGLLIASKGRVVNISSVGAVVNTPWIGIYSSSKAALNMLSDTLRLELSPFKVSVVTIMVGTIASHFHANEPDVVLPPSSRYSAIRDTINRWAKGQAGPKGGSVQDLAESLVVDVVGKPGGFWVWKGPNSGMVKFLTRWVPASTLDGMMSNGQGLDELTKNLQR
ncbi:NAD(P)-binding protein [Canariomyces notabilis]|uniref:NAD(P)-binding protein n=1 Tax=Canariomyces notabilis TaxID=2074819 RepID=A0AAN6T7X1_9PEZI|nr:NAD(P)-binding protein [Canariomyces arenarius]